jgi:hypothetical protein
MSSTHLGPKTCFLLLSGSCGFVDVGHSVIYNWCWPSPAQSFLGLSLVGLTTMFYCLRFDTPQLGGPGPHIYIPQEQGNPVIPLGTGFPFSCLLWLAGLWWRYSNPPPRRDNSTELLVVINKVPAWTTHKKSLSLWRVLSLLEETTCPHRAVP